MLIDQVRSNIQIETPWAKAGQEKSVGTFGNYKAATAVAALQHHLRQWLFLSRGAMLKNSDPLQVDGWLLHLFTEKNKLAPSQYSVPIIFDKKWGSIPVLSEYYFLENKTRTENKYWPKTKKLIYPFCINKSANSKILSVMDPTTGAMLYTSDKFTERNFLGIYNGNEGFRYWFDKAVEISVDQRIKIALFRNQPATNESYNIHEEPEEQVFNLQNNDQILVNDQLDDEQTYDENINDSEFDPSSSDDISSESEITEQDMNEYVVNSIRENN